MERILVTGAASWLGDRIVRILEQRPGTDVLAVDDRPPRAPFSSPFARERIDELSFARRLLDYSPHRLVHLQTRPGKGEAETHPGVAMQALAGALGRCDDIVAVVVLSDGAVYGTGPRHPSVCSETTETAGPADRSRRELEEIEGMVAALAEARPGVAFTVLRPAPLFGRAVDTALSRFLHLPAVPTMLGYDPRLQFLWEEDAVAAVLHALAAGVSGTFNVAAPGATYLSRVLRLGRRPAQPLPGGLHGRAVRALDRAGIGLGRDDLDLLRHGRVIDTGHMSRVLGFTPRLDCRQTILAGYGRVGEEALPPEPERLGA